MKFEMDNPGKRMMLENPEGTLRCEFYTMAIENSNLDKTIHHYEPYIKHCQNLGSGSTCFYEKTSVEKGNELFRKLIREGWKRVTFETKSFA